VNKLISRILALALLAGVLSFSGLDFREFLAELGQPGGPAPSGYTGSNAPVWDRHPERIRIASFNIQVFGISKLAKPQVMDVLARVVRNFDVVAIQEIRATDQTVIPQFVELINSTGAKYDFVLGPRLGRTSSKEQYAFLFDTSRIEVARNSVYTVSDPRDLLHREPLVARFRVHGPDPRKAFTFTLVNIHTDPDETDVELDALADVFRSVQRDGSGEDDVILLGDLNVDDRRLGRLGELPGITCAIMGVPTNTRRTACYDNLVFDRRATVEFTGEYGVLDLMGEYGLTEQQALEVSDHLPVWATFHSYEGMSGPLAEASRDSVR